MAGQTLYDKLFAAHSVRDNDDQFPPDWRLSRRGRDAD